MAKRMGADRWHIAAASARGKAHVDQDLPNQDSVAVRASHDGAVVVAVVSDGAGTAARAEQGSRETTSALAEMLFGLALNDKRSLSIEALTAALTECIEQLRQGFRDTGAPLRDFHCTFVACLLSGDSGFIAYVGDSAAMTTRFAQDCNAAGSSVVDFFPDGQWRLYELERGEYSNETHFITEPNWREFLRVESLPDKFDAVVLMTDGAMDVAISRGKVFRGFLSNLVAKLAETESRAERDATIEAWLDDRQTFAVTGDDKTLFLAMRGRAREAARHEIYLGEAHAPPSAPAAPEATPGHSKVTASCRRDTAKSARPARKSWAEKVLLTVMVAVTVFALGSSICAYVTLKWLDDRPVWDAFTTAVSMKRPPDSKSPPTQQPEASPSGLKLMRSQQSEPEK